MLRRPPRGRPPPHFYSRRFCRSVRRRTQSIRRRRNVKGNFAWGSYGGFLAGSWRLLGGTSASCRLNFAKFSAESRQVRGGPKSFQRLPKRQTEGSQKAPRMPKRQPEGGQKAPRMPKDAENDATERPKAPQNQQKTSLNFQTVFGCPRGCFAQEFCPSFWSMLGPFLKPKSLIVHVIFWLGFWMHFWRPLGAFLVSFWSLLGGIV